MGKRIAIALLCLLPWVAEANGPMGPGSDLQLGSNIFYSGGFGKYWGTNKSVGTIVAWIYKTQENMGDWGDVIICNAGSGGSANRVPLMTPRLEGLGRAHGRPSSGGDLYTRTFYFDSYWTTKGGNGFTNMWILFAAGSDGSTNYQWVNGTAADSNSIVHSSFGTEVWFDTWDPSGVAIGAGHHHGNIAPSGRYHFEGIIDTAIYFPDDLLTTDEIAKIWNTRGRWYPRHNRFLYRGMRGYGTGTSLSSNDVGLIEDGGRGVNMTAQGPVLAADTFTRRRRRQ